MKDFQEDIEVKLKSSDTGVEYHEKASASECELTKECYISVWPRQKYAFAFDLGAGFDFEGASDLCIGFRIDDGNMRYAKTLKAKTRQHTYEEAHVYADAALIGDVASRTESKVLPFEFMATDGGEDTQRADLGGVYSVSPIKKRLRVNSADACRRNDKSHVSRGPYQPEKFHWTPAKGDSGRELKFIFLYAAALDAEKARAAKVILLCMPSTREGFTGISNQPAWQKSYTFAKTNYFEQGIPPSLPKQPAQLSQTKPTSADPRSSQWISKCFSNNGFQTLFGLQDDCDDDEPMPSKRIRTELQTQETPEKISKEPTSVSESSIHDTTANGAIGLRAQREREKKRAEIRRQLREIELERKLAELED
ncbi:hypothetical protein D0861_03541 [Hortaea werneckii]|uniref:Uncharacterized protein n=1 Tax=Hortaea werneckii TaxID=91943 RepID=A0A3M7FPG1_HORWE|nr:hypothetical protein D0861_03541 [Hortaea werneckii]